VRAIGNLKYDVRAAKASRVAELIREAAAGRSIVVAGSTVGGTKDGDPNEESWLTTIWQGMDVKALLVLAPRHPERFVRSRATRNPSDGGERVARTRVGPVNLGGRQGDEVLCPGEHMKRLRVSYFETVAACLMSCDDPLTTSSSQMYLRGDGREPRLNAQEVRPSTTPRPGL